MKGSKVSGWKCSKRSKNNSNIESQLAYIRSLEQGKAKETGLDPDNLDQTGGSSKDATLSDSQSRPTASSLGTSPQVMDQLLRANLPGDYQALRDSTIGQWLALDAQNVPHDDAQREILKAKARAAFGELASKLSLRNSQNICDGSGVSASLQVRTLEYHTGEYSRTAPTGQYPTAHHILSSSSS